MIFSLVSALALAQATPQTADPDGAFNRTAHVEKLNTMLSTGEYDSIFETLESAETHSELQTTLDWLGQRFREGNSTFIAFTYSRLLMHIGNDMPAGAGDELKGTGLAALLYAIGASFVEAQQCADKTARADRAQKFGTLLKASGLLELDEDTRSLATLIALDIEARTWERRKRLDDAEFLCRNGLAAMSAGIEAGNTREGASVDGEQGQQTIVTIPDDFVFERLPNEEWWPVAEKFRAGLPAFLAQIANIDRLPTAEELRAADR